MQYPIRSELLNSIKFYIGCLIMYFIKTKLIKKKLLGTFFTNNYNYIILTKSSSSLAVKLIFKLLHVYYRYSIVRSPQINSNPAFHSIHREILLII